MRQQLNDILNNHFNTSISKLNFCLPGKIESYDHNKKKVSVLPLLKKLFSNGDILSQPVITAVPVIFPGTSEAIIHVPIKKGDGCLLVFSQRSLEKYLSQAKLVEVLPSDPRKFHLSDAICIPGLFTFNKPGKVPSAANNLEINYKNASITIDPSGQISINGNSKAFVTHTELNTALQSFILALNAAFGSKLDGGGSTGLLSLDISAAATTTVKTGG